MARKKEYLEKTSYDEIVISKQRYIRPKNQNKWFSVRKNLSKFTLIDLSPLDEDRSSFVDRVWTQKVLLDEREQQQKPKDFESVPTAKETTPETPVIEKATTPVSIEPIPSIKKAEEKPPSLGDIISTNFARRTEENLFGGSEFMKRIIDNVIGRSTERKIEESGVESKREEKSREALTSIEKNVKDIAELIKKDIKAEAAVEQKKETQPTRERPIEKAEEPSTIPKKPEEKETPSREITLGETINRNFARRLNEDLPIFNLISPKMRQSMIKEGISGTDILGDIAGSITEKVSPIAKFIKDKAPEATKILSPALSDVVKQNTAIAMPQKLTGSSGLRGAAGLLTAIPNPLAKAAGVALTATDKTAPIAKAAEGGGIISSGLGAVGALAGGAAAAGGLILGGAATLGAGAAYLADKTGFSDFITEDIFGMKDGGGKERAANFEKFLGIEEETPQKPTKQTKPLQQTQKQEARPVDKTPTATPQSQSLSKQSQQLRTQERMAAKSSQQPTINQTTINNTSGGAKQASMTIMPTAGISTLNLHDLA